MPKHYKVEQVRKDLYRLYDTRTATQVGVFFTKEDIASIVEQLKGLI